MIRILSIRLAALAAALFMLAACTAVKEPAVAGTFYPAQKEELSRVLDALFAHAAPPEAAPDSRVIAVISPHAAYLYSGHVAAWGYKYVKNRKIKTVVIVGQSHYWEGEGVSVYKSGGFRTPLGDVPVDSDLAGKLINKKAFVDYAPEAFAREHSIEVQIPFLQKALPEGSFRIVPVLFGKFKSESYNHLKNVLSGIMAEETDVLLVASTDLSHYHTAERARQMDAALIETLKEVSSKRLGEALMTGTCEVCGTYAVYLTLDIAKVLGANRVLPLKYANSADAGGDPNSAVGYLSMAFVKENTALSLEEKTELLEMAYQTIESYVQKATVPDFGVKAEKFRMPGATFVTINTGGQLRGCMGNITPSGPLWESVVENAVKASSKDPRFPPMSVGELKEMEVEISVLSPLTPVYGPSDIRVGRDGLLLVKGPQSGLFLPQVPVEAGWDLDQYLANLCVKAGVQVEGCLDGASLYKFSAEVIK